MVGIRGVPGHVGRVPRHEEYRVPGGGRTHDAHKYYTDGLEEGAGALRIGRVGVLNHAAAGNGPLRAPRTASRRPTTQAPGGSRAGRSRRVQPVGGFPPTRTRWAEAFPAQKSSL